MKFEQKTVLLGVVGKKGSGQLDNGQAWHTDRVELHCIAPFPESDTMAVGDTVMTYSVDNFDLQFERAKSLIGQTITLQMEMIPAKKLGQAPKMICNSFYGEPPKVSKSTSSAQA